MNKLSESLKKIWDKFTSFGKAIKIAIIVAIIAIIAAIVSVIVLKNSNKYEVLFSDLEATDAQSVIAQLNADKVDMKIQGNSILVDKSKVDELRMELAPTLNSGSTGYELMDSGSSFGMTDDEFNIKKLRMLQGELEKSIKSLEPVETCKVLISPSEDSVFMKESKEGSATVTLKVKTGYNVSDDQVKAIVALVSRSTSNIPEKNVEVIDTNMNLLTSKLNLGDSDNGSVSSESVKDHKDAESSYESKLQENIVNLLEPIVGKGKVTAKVNVDLDYDSKKVTDTQIDPTKALISQDIKKEYNKDNGNSTSESPVDNNMSNTIEGDSQGATSGSEEQTSNYDHSKTITEVIPAAGEVRRLTASVMVDGNLDSDTQEAFENAIKAAIGFDSNRNDELSVIGMNYDTALDEQKQEQVKALNDQIAAEKRNQIIKYAIIGGIILAAIIAIVIVLVKRKKREEEKLLDVMINDNLPEVEPVNYDPIDFSVNEEKTMKEEEIKKYAKDKPEQVAEIVKSWLSENEG